jgi:hypothetical protein
MQCLSQEIPHGLCLESQQDLDPVTLHGHVYVSTRNATANPSSAAPPPPAYESEAPRENNATGIASK